MADENANQAPPVKCPPCEKGAPKWMATFSDMVTLLLTFFVLLLSFAKTETAKYEAALGSVRNAFGGNVLKHGEVVQRGKSADNAPTMMESQEIIRPFPIEFLTTEGFLDKHEVNRESDEELLNMRSDLLDYDLNDSVDIEEMPEGIKVRMKDKLYFEKGSTTIAKVSIESYERMVQFLKEKNWVIFVEAHSARGERSRDGKFDAFDLSAKRAIAVTRSLVKRGIRADRVTTVFYGDTRPDIVSGNVEQQDPAKNRRAEFIIRKRDLRTGGHKIEAR